MALQRLGSSLYQALRKLTRAPLVDEKAVKALVHDLQRSLLQADVNVDLVMKLSDRIRERILNEKLPSGVSRHEHAVEVVYSELTRLLGEKSQPLVLKPKKGNVFLLVGIEGCGKTTTAVKLASYYQKKGVKSSVVCADTYRPGAFAQIKQLAERAGVPVYGYPQQKDPVKLAKQGIEKFRDLDAIFIDTAGRHKEEKGLMREMRILARKIKPDEVILVVDATVGQQAMVQAKAFHDTTSIGSVFVTKLDGSARGGGALSAVAATGAPIKFIGIGEDVDEIEEFNPSQFVGRLLGMGDLGGLVEKVREAKIAEIAPEGAIQEVLRGKFTLATMYDQLAAMKKLGPFRKLLSMIPGLSYNLPGEMVEEAEERLDRWKVIIQSMTPEERERAEIVRASRIRRIARGSGTTEKDVRDLIRQYKKTRKVLKAWKRKRREGVFRLLKGFGLD